MKKVLWLCITIQTMYGMNSRPKSTPPQWKSSFSETFNLLGQLEKQRTDLEKSQKNLLAKLKKLVGHQNKTLLDMLEQVQQQNQKIVTLKKKFLDDLEIENECMKLAIEELPFLMKLLPMLSEESLKTLESQKTLRKTKSLPASFFGFGRK